jgi:hypothetical protein
MSTLANFADSGIVVTSVGATAARRRFLRWVKVCWAVDFTSRFGFDAFHGEFFADTAIAVFFDDYATFAAARFPGGLFC